MNVFSLKLIALITMIIDHYGAIFQPNIDIYRIIGRIAFPIYAFLLVEGYLHTRDIKRYAGRLILFAIISEIPFDLAFYGKVEFTHQNIFFTLFIGLMAMYFIDRREDYNMSKAIIIIISMIFAMVLAVDYNYLGILYILSFYSTREMLKNDRFLWITGVIFLGNFVSTGFLQQFSLISLIFLYFYNGKLGPKNKFIQIIFYIMYPLHLLVFYFLKAKGF